ncbi:MAG: Ig-like domain-containing protein [Burkholderiaceae bacterium]|nr:Ig-like domain-containing protein [Burkholderiaceae bacterium]
MNHLRSWSALGPLVLSIVLSACGGGSSSDGASGGGNPQPASATPSSGTLVDSPVAGIGYRTATRSGTTDANGRFDYLPGETVTFFIGNVTLPPIPAKATITPFDFSGSPDSFHQIALNVASFLQSLDSDGNPANGISIPSTAAAPATGGIDFNVPVATFAQNASLVALVRDANPGGRTPADGATARQHALQSLSELDSGVRPNLTPIADASASADAVLVGQSLTLSGQQSSDPNGDTLSYRWSLTDKPAGSQATLAATDASQLVFTPDVAGSYTMSLVVSDGRYESAADTVTVVASTPPPPTPATLTGLSIASAPARLAVGGTHALVAMASYSDNSTADVTGQASWSSDAAGTASVNASTGLVSANAVGTANIGASFDGASAPLVAIPVVDLSAPHAHQPTAGSGSVTLSWNPVADAGSYTVYWLEDAAGVSTGSNRIESVSSGHVHAGLAGGKPYAYRVAAVLGNVERLSEETYAYVYGAGQPSGNFVTGATPPRTRSGASLIALPNGKVLITGGTVHDVPADLYDPASDSYSQVSTPAGRQWHGAAATPMAGGKVLVTGVMYTTLVYVGMPPFGSFEEVERRTNEILIYDSDTNGFIAGPTLPEALSDAVGVRLLDGRILLTGGTNDSGPTANTVIFDPVAGTATAATPMAEARYGHKALLLRDGRVLVFGGSNASALATTTIYDPASGAFTAGPSTATVGDDIVGAELPDGRILLIGHRLPSGVIERHAQIFDPANDSLTDISPTSTTRLGASIVRLPDGRLLHAGGTDGGDVLGTEAFDPVGQSFSGSGSLPFGMQKPLVALLRDGRALLYGANQIVFYGP